MGSKGNGCVLTPELCVAVLAFPRSHYKLASISAHPANSFTSLTGTHRTDARMQQDLYN